MTEKLHLNRLSVKRDIVFKRIFAHKGNEIIDLDSENSKELEEIMKKNNIIKKANDELEYLEGDEAFKRKVELREKYERDLASALYNREEKGKLEGKLESKKEIAKKMIQKGMSLKEIEELTGLTEEELKNI